MVCRGSGELITLAGIIEAFTRDGDRWRAGPPDGWTQGRTVYGGLIAGLATEAARRTLAAPAPLRAAQFAFVGPAAGALTFAPKVLRAGRSVTFVGVDVTGEDGNIATRALLCFGQARASTLSRIALPMPQVPAPASCDAVAFGGMGPAFLSNFEFLPAGPSRFGSGGAEARMTAWCRHRHGDGIDPAVALVTLGDVSPPAPLVLMTELVPVSTMTWSVELGTDPGHGGNGGWRLVELVGEMIAEGYAAERIAIWAEDGTPLMTARQSVAVFG